MLVAGLPSWGHPSYYYRRARKLGVYGVAFVTLAFCTLAQLIFKVAAVRSKRQKREW